MKWWMKLLNLLRLRAYERTEHTTQLLCGGRHALLEHFFCAKTGKSVYGVTVKEIEVDEHTVEQLALLAFCPGDPEKMKKVAEKQGFTPVMGEQYRSGGAYNPMKFDEGFHVEGPVWRKFK